ncbi:hypothetical protein DL767_004205 [Monosporascus sp. MG133]|nr:hypothetical protein DL767_004205 [Monosporascus sp. MG133]
MTANRGQGHSHHDIEQQLSNRFRDAACEAFALSPSRFRNHPNIVQLKGWGLCLDTLESPARQCCDSLQVPMLILEKAYMNLAEFLQKKLFANRQSTGDVESGPPDTSPDTPSALKRWASVFTEDPYEIIRLLCIDIGHGLGAIHHHRFSHGDLKPENILVFRPGTTGSNTRWVAKICDFGSSSGEDEDPSSTGQKYMGTGVWRPPREEIENSLSADDLRKCDIYVYGLVVWSAFCLKGWHRLSWGPEELKEDLESLSSSGPFPLFGRHTLRNRVEHLLQEAREKLGKRNMEPWKFLYMGREDRRFSDLSHLAIVDPSPTGNDLETGSSFQLWFKQPLVLRLSRRDVACVPRAEREGYNGKHWWKTNSIEDESKSSAVSATLADGDVRAAEPADHILTVNPKENTSNRQSIPTASSSEQLEALDRKSPRTTVSANQLPAESHPSSEIVSPVARDIDDLPLSTDEFTTKRRKDDVKEVHVELLRLVTQESWDLALARELYFCARYRSRMKYAWWSECAPGTNVLERALNLRPAVDICTLAWLAKGKIGNSEATNLATNWVVWSSILDPDGLDESERLSRMLLLIQAGAPVERILRDRGECETILMAYIRRCRSVIIPVVAARLHRIFLHRPGSDIITSETEYYITGVGNVAPSRVGKTLLHDMLLSRRIDPATYLATKIILGQDTSTNTARPSQNTRLEVERLATPAEDTALLPSQLPDGWIEHYIDNKKGPGKSFYEEVFTQSFTLTKPEFACSLVRSGEIKIGDLGTNRVVSYLALPSLVQRAGGGDDDGTPRSDIVARFPIYDEPWFTSEWLRELPQGDVLGTMSEPWKLPSFTVRIPNLNIMQTIWFDLRWLSVYLRWLSVGIWRLVKMLALVTLAAGLLLPLLWFFLPIIFSVLLIYGVPILMAISEESSVGDDGRGLRVLVTLVSMLGGAIVGALIMQAICSNTPDGILKTGFQLKIDYVDFMVTSHIMKCHQPSFPVSLSSVEVNATQDGVQPRKKMKVNFQDNYGMAVFTLSDAQSSPSKASRLAPEIVGLHGADDICRVICQQANPKRSSTVECVASCINAFDNYHHFLYPSDRHGESPCREPMTELVPFVRVLNRAIDYALSVPQQLRLALIIARGMLQLHDTPRWRHYWTLQDLSYFHNDDNLAESLSTLHVSTELVTRQNSVANGIPDEIPPSSKEAAPLCDGVKEAQLTYGIRNITVYSLGVALLEIGYWCALNPNDVVVHWGIVYVADRGLATYIHLAFGPKEMRTTKQHTYECIDSGQWKAETSERLLVAFELARYEEIAVYPTFAAHDYQRELMSSDSGKAYLRVYAFWLVIWFYGSRLLRYPGKLSGLGIGGFA